MLARTLRSGGGRRRHQRPGRRALLSAAAPDARVLILDTNDDFGGHAKRNEFVVDGRTLLGYGGTQSIDSPAHNWDGVAKGLLKDLGIDVRRFDQAFDQEFFARWNLSHAVFFKKEVFGVDRLVRRPFGTWQEVDENPRDSRRCAPTSSNFRWARGRARNSSR